MILNIKHILAVVSAISLSVVSANAQYIWAPELGAPVSGSATVGCAANTYSFELTSADGEDADFDGVLDYLSSLMGDEGYDSWASFSRYTQYSDSHIILYISMTANSGPERSLFLGDEDTFFTLTQQAAGTGPADGDLMQPSAGRNWILAATYTGADAATCTPTYDVTYLNGIGLEVQKSMVGAARYDQDIVSITTYDALLRKTKQWLPFSADVSGEWITDRETEQATWYYDHYDENEYDYTFAKTRMEVCPSGRQLTRALPGSDMAGHETTISYLTNTAADSIAVLWHNPYFGTLFKNGYYPEGSLTGVRAIDSDGRETVSWADAEGRTIRTDSRLDAATVASVLYVFDKKGNLVWVVQPEGAKRIGEQFPTRRSFISPDSVFAGNYCFVYEYDDRGRIASKSLPGKGKETFSYDALDRIIGS